MRKKKPEKPRKAKAAPKRAASVAAERDDARAFELGEQMTAMRQERDRAAAESATRLKALLEVRASLERMDEHIRRHEEELAAVGAEAAKAQAELAEVVKVLDKLAPKDQYGSISAAVREALEAHRKQRDEVARSHAIKATAAEIKLREAQARIASLEATIPLETAELHSKVADYEVELRMSSRERTELRAILDAVARALTGQDPGPLDAAFRVAADVAKLRKRVGELEAALVKLERQRDDIVSNCTGAVADRTRLREQVAKLQAALVEESEKAAQFGAQASIHGGDLNRASKRIVELEGALRASDAALRSLTSWEAGQCPDCHAPRGARHLATCKLAAAVNRNRAVLSGETPPTVPPSSQAPAQSQADGGARPCRACRFSPACKCLLGPSYRDAGPCDWSPSRFQAAPGICPKCRDFNVYGTETQCANCTAREAARSTAPAESGTASAAGDATAPEEHVHHCSCHGASIPCNRQDPDACRERVDGWHRVFCRERVEAHCRPTEQRCRCGYVVGCSAPELHTEGCEELARLRAEHQKRTVTEPHA